MVIRPTKIRRPNEVVLAPDGETAFLVIHPRGATTPLMCPFPASHFDLVRQFRWHIDACRGTGYVSANAYVDGRLRPIGLHQLLMISFGDSVAEVDHINGNGLDNRFANLRLCSRQQNQFNRRKIRRATSSKFIGVHWKEAAQRFVAVAKIDGKIRHIGTFVSEHDAAAARDAAVLKARGKYARLNFPVSK